MSLQKEIDRLKKLGGISIRRDADGRGNFNLYAGGSAQTNTFSNAGDINTINAIFGKDFYQEQLMGGNFDALAVDGVISGEFAEDGTFGINLNLGSAPAEGGGSLDFTDPVSQIDTITETGTTTSEGGSSPASSAGSTTTSTGSTSGGSTGPVLSTGTGSFIDQQLQTQSQLLGQQAYNAQQQNFGLLDNLLGQKTELGNISDVLSSLFSNNFKNEDFGLGSNFARQQALRKAGRGTASTKVQDKSVQQALLSQPTLLKG